MQGHDWIFLIFFLIILTLITKPLGIYISKVLNHREKTFLDCLFKPLEKLTYRWCRIEVDREQDWKEYLFSIVAFSFVSLVITFILLGLQQWLPLNPAKMAALSAHLNFNTSVSFMTNTNWQSYGGESTMSYFSQMVALTLQNFVSPAVGLCVAAVLVRGIARHNTKSLGNFWVDLVRVTYYLLLPIAFVFALFFISQGTPQNFNSYTDVATLDGGKQTILQGPIASQEAIKLLGTNGGGFTNVNSGHPYENSTPLSNFFQLLLMLAIPAGQTYYFGREVKNQKHGWGIYIVMALIFAVGVIICVSAERKGNPQFASLGIENTSGNMEGKEQRFGIFNSALFATVATATSTGAVNSAHDSYTPIGGLIPMLNMQLGEILFGGVGSGLYSMILFVILSVFTAGLVIGRKPEYLGKRIEAYDIKASLFALIPYHVAALGFTAWACVTAWGTATLGNTDVHGFSEILYAFSSTTANNGSAFAGLTANVPCWDMTLAVAMLIGRFLVMAPVMALAGSLAMKKQLPLGSGSFPVSGLTFKVLLIGVIILVGALCYLPALIMGPLLEQFFMDSLKLF